MQKAIHLKATVLPEGKIEIKDTGLKEGESVDVIVMQSEKKSGRSALDIIREGPSRHIFKTPADVEEYLRAERESWDRPLVNTIEEELKNRSTEAYEG